MIGSGRRSAYNYIDRFVQIDDNAVLINNRNGRDGTFRKHVDNIKNGRVEACCSNGVVRIVAVSND